MLNLLKIIRELLKKRIYKHFNKIEFIAAVRKLPWLEIYLCEDVQTVVSLLTDKLNSILDRMAPVITVQVRTKYAVWLSENTKYKIRERNEARKKAEETKTMMTGKGIKI